MHILEIGIKISVPNFQIHLVVNQVSKRKFNKLSNLGVVRISAKTFQCTYASHQNLGSFFLSLCPCTHVSFCWEVSFPISEEPETILTLQVVTMPAPRPSISKTAAGQNLVELNRLLIKSFYNGAN